MLFRSQQDPLHPERTYIAIYAIKTSQEPLSIRTGPDINSLSGAYPTLPESQKRGLADLACGIGGFTEGGSMTGWDTVIAVDAGQQAAKVYNTLHGQAGRCLTADLFQASTLHQVATAAPKVLAMGFPCQPWSLSGAQGGFADDRSRMLVALLAYAVVIQPIALVLENVAAFASTANGYYLDQLQQALGGLTVPFVALGETVDLQETRPIKRPRWLALCPRQQDWVQLSPQAQHTVKIGRAHV